MELTLEVIFGYESLTSAAVWRLLRQLVSARFPDSMQCSLDGEVGTLDSVAASLHRKSVFHFSLAFGKGRLDYSQVGAFDHSLLRIEGFIAAQEEAELWFGPFLSVEGFRQGRIYEVDYEYWQNATDPLEFQARGRTWQGLPMKSNGLPVPLDRLIVDTSKNPGRRVLRQGYVEAVGALMWFGKQFWQVTGGARECIVSQTWIRCDEFNGVLRVRAYDQPFTSDTGDQASIQNRLRDLLFPAS